MTPGVIHTVLGPVDPQTVSSGLMHEHLVIDYGELLGRPKQVPDPRSPVEAQVIANVRAYAAAGGSLLVDCTPPGYGRYADLLAAVSAATGVHVVATTGGFTEQWAPLHPVVRALDPGVLADLFERELTEGMAGTRYRAGAIKIATSEGRMTEGEERIFRAAARAHRATGAPIITHTTNGFGPEQLAFLMAEGVDSSRVVIGHIGFGPDPRADMRAILNGGGNVALDRIGHHHFFADEHWVDLLIFGLELGYEDHLVLSHDAVTEFYGPEPIKAHTFSDYAYILTAFLPRLRAAGVPEQTIEHLVRDNPRRILAYRLP